MHLRRYMNHESSLGVVRRVSRVSRKVSMLDFLWIPAVLVFGVGDIVTTRFALHLGAVEGNDLVRFILEEPGGGLWGFAVLKATILLVLLFLSFAALDRFRWVVPSLLCYAGVCLLVGNASVILSLL